MYVSRLELTNFRCYGQLELVLPRGVVVVTGGNAQGKTTLLEALYVLATTRSPHASSDSELVSWEASDDIAPHARLRADIVRSEATDALEIVYVGEHGPNGKARFSKRARLNGASRKAMDVIGHLAVALFDPRDLKVVDGSPAERRRYLDVLLCQVDREYCRSLSRYNRIVSSRNQLLRRLREHGGDSDELAYWDQLLAKEGGIVVARRHSAVAAIAKLARSFHSGLASGAGNLAVEYESEVVQQMERTGDGVDHRPFEEALARLVSERRRAELARGMGLVGPQRDDLKFQVDRVDMRYYGSRGQQRSVMLALKLSEAEYMHSLTGERPVLLLDDVLSELDVDRRHRLLDALRHSQQVLITTTDIGFLPSGFLRDALLLEVERGTVLPRSSRRPSRPGTETADDAAPGSTSTGPGQGGG